MAAPQQYAREPLTTFILFQQIIVLSLAIIGIYTAFQQGNVLSFVRVAVANLFDKWLGKKLSRYVQKPLWDCLACMASVWTIILTRKVDVVLILAVCGLNAIVDRFLNSNEICVNKQDSF